MMRALATVAALAIAACAPTDAQLEVRVEQAVATAVASSAAPDLNRLYHQTRPSVFYIDPTNRQHGTGWLLEPGFIVTAAHVVEGREQVLVRQASAPVLNAAVVGLDQRRDVALLRYDTNQAQPAPYRRAAPVWATPPSTTSPGRCWPWATPAVVSSARGRWARPRPTPASFPR